MSRFLDELSVTPLADGVQWRLNTDFRYESDAAGLITVPGTEPDRKFVSDFASIPRALWGELPPWQRYGAAAIVHDWLYWSQPCTRDLADGVLREAMQTLAVADGTISKIYQAVRIFGQASWDRNAQLKATEFTRMASPNPNPPYAAIL